MSFFDSKKIAPLESGFISGEMRSVLRYLSRVIDALTLNEPETIEFKEVKQEQKAA